jgi:hypothetical protein
MDTREALRILKAKLAAIEQERRAELADNEGTCANPSMRRQKRGRSLHCSIF